MTDEFRSAVPLQFASNISSSNNLKASGGVGNHPALYYPISGIRKEDKLAKTFKVVGHIILFIITAFASAYYCCEFINEDKNSMVHTDVEAHTEFINAPYFYFSCLNASKLDIRTIQMIYYGPSPKTFNFSKYNGSNYKYSKSTIDWSVVYLNETDQSQTGTAKNILVIPPYGQTISKRHSLKIDTIVDKYTDDPLRDLWSGIFWAVDSVEDGIISQQQSTNNIGQYFFKRFGSAFFQHEYSTFAAVTESALEVIIEKNDFYLPPFEKSNPKINEYYKADKKMEAYHQALSDNLTHNNSFFFYINPTGAGVKTNITTEINESFIDVLSHVGGIFSPSLTIILIIVNIFIYGCNIVYGMPKCCPCGYGDIGGFAKNKRTENIPRQQIIQILRELKVPHVNPQNEENASILGNQVRSIAKYTNDQY